MRHMLLISLLLSCLTPVATVRALEIYSGKDFDILQYEWNAGEEPKPMIKVTEGYCSLAVVKGRNPDGEVSVVWGKWILGANGPDAEFVRAHCIRMK